MTRLYLRTIATDDGRLYELVGARGTVLTTRDRATAERRAAVLLGGAISVNPDPDGDEILTRRAAPRGVGAEFEGLRAELAEARQEIARLRAELARRDGS